MNKILLAFVLTSTMLCGQSTAQSSTITPSRQREIDQWLAQHPPRCFPISRFSEYPVAVRIVETHWQDTNWGASGFGRGNICVDGSWIGFDYTYLCSRAFLPSDGNGQYPAKWKKPETRLILRTSEIGNPEKHHNCELKTSLKNFEYVVVGGNIATRVPTPK